jgi:putative sigma-54 modulation protein
MHITITGVHLEITEAIREYVNNRISSLNKYSTQHGGSAKVAVELSKTTAHHSHGDVFQVEAQAHINGTSVNVRSVKDDLYSAIDEVRDMLARELTEEKDKKISLFKKGAHKLKKLLKFQND